MAKIISQTKICTTCKTEKSISDFHKMNKRNRVEVRSKCITCEREYGVKWAKNNRDKITKKNKSYYERNKEKENKRSIAWQKRNPERTLELARRVYARNPEKSKMCRDRWRKNNPEKVTIIYQNRRARVKGNGGTFTSDEWKEVCSKYGFTCLKCGRKDLPLTIDHVVPISLGGKNTIDNVQPLCKSCNSRKHTKIIDYRK